MPIDTDRSSMKPIPLTFKKKLALELWRKREQNMLQEHPLQQLFWECTLRCNLHCRHCGSDCKSVAAQADMPKEDFLRVLDSIAARTAPHQVFVIISGDDLTPAVLGYTDSGNFDYSQIPDNMKSLLAEYENQIDHLRQQGASARRVPLAEKHPKVPQLMTSKWNQGNPYNQNCPNYFSLGKSVRCLCIYGTFYGISKAFASTLRLRRRVIVGTTIFFLYNDSMPVKSYSAKGVTYSNAKVVDIVLLYVLTHIVARYAQHECACSRGERLKFNLREPFLVLACLYVLLEVILAACPLGTRILHVRI